MALFRKQFKKQIRAYKKKGFILIEGDAPVMLIAHLDTVHKERVKFVCKSDDDNILMSPQGIGGDDRCGVYALLSIYESAKTGQKPWLLFTCDEEIGGLGADNFCLWHEENMLPPALQSLKMLIEIDRKGSKDAVYYDCDNKDFEDYVTSKGFVTQYGTFSDISYIAPELGVAAVNLSSGYYNAHTKYEFINRKHLNATIDKVKEMIADATKPDFPFYEYVEKVRVVSKRINDNYKSLWNYPRSSFDYDGYFSGQGDWADDGIAKYNEKTEQDKAVAEVPTKYRQQYDELLEIYEQAELDELRKQFGDVIIQELYDEEILGLYDWQDSMNTENPNDSTKDGDNTAKK